MSGIKDGMLVSEIKKDSNKSIVIITRERKKYDSVKKDNYLLKFDYFCKENIIENSNFDDNCWTIKNEEDGYIDRKQIKFAFETKKKLNEAIKFYCIELLTNSLSPNYVYLNITFVTRALFYSNFFNEDYYEDFEDYVYSLSDNQQAKFRDALWQFLSYFPNKLPVIYKSCISDISNPDRKSRILPDYRSILYFDYFMKKFEKEASYSEKTKYYPIIIWWELTSIIPMRVIEFSRIKKNTCVKKKGDYYIGVTRAKPHSYLDRALKLRKKQKFKITEKLYNMIKEYINIDKNESNYILSYNLYKKCFAKNSVMANYKLIPKFNLKNILDSFYEEIIQGKYGFNPIDRLDVCDKDIRFVDKTSGNCIVKLKLGDTRHLAIMNLILSGRNPYIIKELAGHRDINSFEHYGNHIEKFVESKTLVLTDDIRRQINEFDEKIIPIKLRDRRGEKINELLIQQNIKTENIIYTEKGYCKRYIENIDLYPALCQGLCKNCNDFIRDITQVYSEDLESELIEIQNQIKMQIDIIKLYLSLSIKMRLIDTKTGEFNLKSNALLKTTTNRLEALIRNEANVKAYQLKINQINIMDCGEK
jgi:hypothetical protein